MLINFGDLFFNIHCIKQGTGFLGMFAGHDQCGGELVEEGGKKFKMFYGMSSKTAQTIHKGGAALIAL